jgi:hypothetical protein
MFAVIIISLTLLGISGVLIDSHRRTWREARDSATVSERDKRFARAMYRRRMQASGTIALMGAAIGVWPIVDQQARPWGLLLYTAMLLVACSWIMVLAMFDFWATRRHYQRVRMEQLAKQVKLAVELSSMSDRADAERGT